MYPNRLHADLHQFFAGVTEHAFQSRLGMADPPLVDYISELLTRFIACDSIYGVRSPSGRRLLAVADMLVEADSRMGEARRDVHRHIGDFTLFWTGVYPEAVEQFRRRSARERLIDYREQGKRAYLIASSIPTSADDEQNELLERLSHDFELCALGLSEVRREWENRGNGPLPGGPIVIS